jgi:uncharacterized membrane protein SirB2
VPHVVDTVLLLSAVGMLFVLHLSPFALPWLRAKVVGLAAYIALGALALRPARSAAAARPGIVTPVAWIAALGVFAYIVSVAVTKSPRGALAWLPAQGG